LLLLLLFRLGVKLESILLLLLGNKTLLLSELFLLGSKLLLLLRGKLLLLTGSKLLLLLRSKLLLLTGSKLLLLGSKLLLLTGSKLLLLGSKLLLLLGSKLLLLLLLVESVEVLVKALLVKLLADRSIRVKVSSIEDRSSLSIIPMVCKGLSLEGKLILRLDLLLLLNNSFLVIQDSLVSGSLLDKGRVLTTLLLNSTGLKVGVSGSFALEVNPVALLLE